MTAVTATPPALQQYLRRATAGLPPAKRQEVWDELEEHVYCRAEALEWQGAAPEQALAQVLAELGPPLRVSAGMNGVHNMPKMIAAGVIGMLAVSAGLYALAGGGQGNIMNAQTVAPRKLCLPLKFPVLTLERLPGDKDERCYSDPRNTVHGLFLDAQGAKKLLETLGVRHWQDGVFINYVSPDDRSGFSSLDPKYKKGNRFFYSIGEALPIAFEASANKLFVKNAERPVFYGRNGVQIGFDTVEAEFGQQAYRAIGELAAGYIYGLQPNKVRETAEVAILTGQWVKVQTSLDVGEVVGVFQWAKSEIDPSYAPEKRLKHFLRFDVSPVDSKGKVSFHLPKGATFTTRVSQGADAQFLLVRLTNTPLNNLKSGIFLPKP